MIKAGGVVLCGGQSRRMGRSKADLPFGAETMLQRVVRLLGDVVSPIIVVAAADQRLPALPENVQRVSDRAPQQGPLEGLRAGLAAIVPWAEAAYVTSCDVPLLSHDFVREMVGLIDDHDAAVPVDERYQHPLAAVYQTRLLPHIERLLEAGQRRPAFLLDAVDTLRVPVQRLRKVDPDLRTLWNLNSPEDYQKALRAAGLDG
jgi:molybdopterin-guanine dinucleotide biosynthesis protein A